MYVNDAFGAAHRAHASTEGVAHLLPAVAGLLMDAELRALGGLLTDPARPFVVVLGGAKVSDKIGVVTRMLEFADQVLIGGAMCFTFLRAQGLATGTSRVEEESLDVARQALAAAQTSGHPIVLPADFLVAGRKLPWFVLVFTLLSSWIGAGSLFAGGENAYRNGFASLWQPARCSGTVRWACSRSSRSAWALGP